jgi:repressor of nif and glnA expression
MNPDLSKKVSSKIELLCEAGCTQVNQVLEKAGNGEIIEELAEFNAHEIEQIVIELTNIMAVYEVSDAEDCD